MATEQNRGRSETLEEKLARKKELEREQFRMMKDLYTHYRNGTFLSIDIVDSTRLKEGEDSLEVVHTFQAFHRYINENIYGSKGSVFSGDGVMCLFERAQEAVNAGLRVFKGLTEFNRQESRLKRYLNLRMGINSGTLLVDDHMDIGKMTERNIDIAGHLQKFGEVGRLYISAFTWEQIADQDDFEKMWKTIDNTVVYRHRENFTPLSELDGAHKLRQIRLRTGQRLARIRKALLGKRLWRIAAIAVLVAGLAAIVMVSYRRDSPGSFTGTKNVPLVVNNRIENMPSDKNLGDVVMWKKGKLVELPDKVYLVIPPGKNSRHNRELGLTEETLIILRRGTDRKYYLDKKGILDKLGIFDAYVETYNGYWIFFKEKDALNHLKKKRR